MAGPTPRDEQVSRRMKRQPNRGTTPERELAAQLRAFRYLVTENDPSLPGSPDLVLERHRLVIFVHGCFWHGCPEHFKLPRHNRRWWRAKIEANKRRDRRKADAIRRLGWSVCTVWEHSPPDVAAARIRRLIRRRAGLG